jgi:Tripartite tricarboxylate transporter family receptor
MNVLQPRRAIEEEHQACGRPKSGVAALPRAARRVLPGNNYEYATWYGFLAPAKTPESVLQLLNRAITELDQDPELRAKILAHELKRDMQRRRFIEAATDMFSLPPPRHISTLQKPHSRDRKSNCPSGTDQIRSIERERLERLERTPDTAERKQVTALRGAIIRRVL